MCVQLCMICTCVYSCKKIICNFICSPKEESKLKLNDDGFDEDDVIYKGVHYQQNCKSTGFIVYTVSSHNIIECMITTTVKFSEVARWV